MANEMSAPLIRWPHYVGAGGNAFTFGDNPVYASATKYVYYTPFNSYIIGTGPTGYGDYDWVWQFAFMLNAAYDSLYGGSTGFTVDIDGEGRLVVTNNNANTLYMYPTLVATTTTIPVERYGFSSLINTAFTGGGAVTVATGRTIGQWYSGINAEWNGPEMRRKRRYEDESVSGRPVRQVHSVNGWVDRTLIWHFVRAARVIQARSLVLAYADIAGVNQGAETIEDLIDYLDSSDSWLYPRLNKVYVFEDRTLNSACSAPYDVNMGKSGYLEDVKQEQLVQDMSSETYGVKLVLWRQL